MIGELRRVNDGHVISIDFHYFSNGDVFLVVDEEGDVLPEVTWVVTRVGCFKVMTSVFLQSTHLVEDST